jgi:ribosomal protein S26
MARGRSQLITCCFCGRRIPSDKAIRTTRYSFSYFDERAGLQHRGTPTTAYCCPACGRHRTIKDQRPRVGMPKGR